LKVAATLNWWNCQRTMLTKAEELELSPLDDGVAVDDEML
jgi:hypothetical protein